MPSEFVTLLKAMMATDRTKRPEVEDVDRKLSEMRDPEVSSWPILSFKATYCSA